MYGDEVEIQELNNDIRKKLELDLELYGFNLTLEDLEKLLTEDEKPLVYINHPEGYARENVQLIACKKIFINQRETLKLVVWKNGKFSFLNKYAKPTNLPCVNVSYDFKDPVIWDNLKEGLYVVFSPLYWDGKLKIATLTDCMSKTQAEEWLALYRSCLEKEKNFRGFEEMHSVSDIDNTGIIETEKLRDWERRIDLVISQIQELERQEGENKANALKTCISIQGKRTVIKALDEHTYTIEVPEKTPWTKEDWTYYVYRHRYQWKQWDKQICKEHTLFNEIILKLVKTSLEWFKFSVDSRTPVKIAIKNIKNKKGQVVTLAYLNDKKVAYHEMLQALFKYFMQGEALQPRKEEKRDEEEERKKALEIRKLRDEAIITSGITGYIRDLEGETPITIGFEKIGANWYLVIGEKKVYLKGGIEAIRSLERVLKGTALEYSARHSTQELYERLSQIIGSKEAIEVISEAKQLGKLLNVLEK